jgi:hypothetical protein
MPSWEGALGGAGAGYQVGGPIGAGIGGVIGGLTGQKKKKDKSPQKQYQENVGFIRTDMLPMLLQLIRAQQMQGQLGGSNLALQTNAAGGMLGGGNASFGGLDIARALARGYSQSQAATAGAQTNFDANMGFHQIAANAAGTSGTAKGNDPNEFANRLFSLIGSYALTKGQPQQQPAAYSGANTANPYAPPKFGTGNTQTGSGSVGINYRPGLGGNGRR